jgi:ABC-2 type transport system permease protein
MMRSISRLAWVEFKLHVREPFTLVFVFMFPIVLVLVLSGVFGTEAEQEWGGTTPANYYVGAYIATVITALSLVSLPVHLASYRERGILRRFTASSVSAQTLLLAHLVVGLVLATMSAIALVTVDALVYDIEFPVSPLGMVVSFFIGAASFITLGMLIGTLMPTARSAQAVGLGLFFPTYMLSGAGPPPEVMTSTMQSISDVLPTTRLVSALQAPWFGDGIDLGELAILGGVFIVSAALAVLRLRSRA